MKRKLTMHGFSLVFMLFILFTSSKICFAEGILTEDPGINQNVIYLTFDDGPISPVTDNILDVLKAKGVKATFFVIGKKVKIKEDVMKRIYEEGHGIGLHTFTHEYGKIYSSNKAFIDEMDKTSDAIFEVLGIRPTAIRFPTGSIGHLNKSLYLLLTEKNYRIFDWNARITDGVHPNKSPEVFCKEAIKTSKKWKTVFMLMHCDAPNYNTCKALPQIIDYFKENNYQFKVIDDTTEPYFFRFSRGN